MELDRHRLERFKEDDYDSTQFEVVPKEEPEVLEGLTVGRNKNGEIVEISYRKIQLYALGQDKERKPFTESQLQALYTIFVDAYNASSEPNFSNKYQTIADEIAGAGKGYGLLNRIWLMVQSDKTRI